jgi:hypothetical protein
MPLIQIEQDSPAVIQIVRERIVAMVNKLRQYHAGKDLQYGVRMHEAGYIGALMQHDLISMNLYDQLWDEQETAYVDTLAEQAAKTG